MLMSYGQDISRPVRMQRSFGGNSQDLRPLGFPELDNAGIKLTPIGQQDTAINWGRYGELYSYRAHDGQLVLTAAAGSAAGHP
jgi:hypothetical protein